MNAQHDCQLLLSSISDYVDGDLRQELCAELERHLSECENCRVVVNTLRKTIDLYHVTAAEETLPEDVRSRLFYRLELNDVRPDSGAHALAARPGELCPNCGQGVMDYDGLLVLKCPACGFSQAGCST